MKKLQKVFVIIATFALIFNSLATPLSVLAQETTPEPTAEATVIPSETATPEPTVEPTITPEATATPLDSPEPSATAVEATVEASPTDTATATPTDLASPEPTAEAGQPSESSTPVATATPEATATPTSTPTFTATEPKEEGTVTTTIVTTNVFPSTVQNNLFKLITDKLDYAPTEAAIITGSDFTSNKTYSLTISSTDDPATSTTVDVTTDGSGNFTYTYQLDGNYRPNYSVEVKDGEVVVATTTFTDSTVDTTPPTGGSISYFDGWRTHVPARALGESETIGITSFSDLSGIASQTLELYKAPLSNGVCGSFILSPGATQSVSVGTISIGFDDYPGMLEDGYCHQFKLSAIDNAGNSAAFVSPSILKYDTTIPSVTIDSAIKSTSKLYATWTGTDAQSGISSYMYKLWGGSCGALSDVGQSWNMGITANNFLIDMVPGVGAIEFKATNNAGLGGITASPVCRDFITDTTAPVLTVPSDKKVESTGDTTSVSIGTATATDAVDPSPVITNDAPSSFSNGTTIVTWTATDFMGNSATGTQKIVVTNKIPAERLPTLGTLTGVTLTPSLGKVSILNGLPSTVSSVSNPTLFAELEAQHPGSGSTAGNRYVGFMINPPVVAGYSWKSDSLIETISGHNYGSEDRGDSGTHDDGTELWETVTVKSGDVYNRTFTTPKNYEITWIFGKSGSPNKEFTELFTVEQTLDTTGPTIASHSDITIEATGPSGAVVTYTSPTTSDNVDPAGTATCSPVSGSTFALGNTTVTCSATDSNGNTATPTTFIIHVVDSTLPTISAAVSAGTTGTNGWYTSDVTVHFTCADTESGIANCPVDQILSTEGSSVSSLAMTATDNSGNTSAPSNIVTVKIDKTGPSADLVVTAGTSGSNGWYTSDVTISMNCSDSISAIVSYTSPQYQTTETSGQIFNGLCENWAGLTTNASPLTVKLDKTTPTVTIQDPSVNAYYNHTTSIPLNYTATDTNLDSCWYKLDGGVSIQMSACSNTTFNAAQGSHKIQVFAKDLAGSTGSSALTDFTVDTTAPTVSSVDSDGQTYNLASTNPTIKVTFSENIANTPYISVHSVPVGTQIVNNCGDGDAKTFCFTYSIITGQETTHTIYISNAQDIAGNTMTQDQSHTFYVDTKAPTATINYSTTNWTNGDVVATLDPSEHVSETNNEGAQTYTFSSNGTFTFEFVDDAENPGSATATVSNIDKVNPTGSWITPIDGSTVSGNVPLQFDATDDASGVASVVFAYSNDNDDFVEIDGDSWDTTTLPLGNYTLRATVTDNAGNTANFDETVGIAAVISTEEGWGNGNTTALITWTTDRPTKSRIVYDTVSHTTLGDAPNYGYAFSTETFNSSPEVLSHSVTIDGLSAGTMYYYRTVSAGSPTAISDQHTFSTLSYAGPPMSSGDNGNGGAQVLGVSTANVPTGSWSGSNGVNIETTVLGAEASATPEATVLPQVPVITSPIDTNPGFIKWLLTHKIISIEILLILLITAWQLYEDRKNKS